MDALISITGNLGTDVEVRATRNNQPMATFRVGCTPRYRTSTGEWTDSDTTWMTVRCYRWLAENVAFSLRKGDPVLVTGRLRTSVWTDDKGVRHERAEIDASSVGHDLNRGSSHFRRSDRPVLSEAPDPANTEDDEPRSSGADADRAGGDPWSVPGVTAVVDRSDLDADLDANREDDLDGERGADRDAEEEAELATV